MSKNAKLATTGLLVLLVTVGVVLAMRSPEEEPPAVRAVPTPKERTKDKLADLTLDEAPPEVTAVDEYIEDRWGHLKDSGVVAPAATSAGERFYVGREAIVGLNGEGETIYARSIMRAHKFEGPVFTYGDSPASLAAKVETQFKRGELSKKLRSKRIPLDELGIDFGPGEKGD